MEAIIETIDLTKVYGSKDAWVTALNGVNLRIEKGEFLGIMGPSGAGKTTLLNILSTIDAPSKGSVLFEGKDTSRMNSRDLAKFRREKVGFIFQDFNLLDNMTVEDNIVLPLALSGMKAADISAKLDDMAAFFGLQDQLKKHPHQLSGGQKQRTAAARALITSPAVIFADEPSGALDSKSSAELLQCMADMNARYGSSVVMVTHDAFAASFCRKILFLKDGRIFAELQRDESRKELFSRILNLLSSMGGYQHELV